MKKFFAILSLLLICGNVFAQTNTKIDNLGDGLSYSKISSRLSDIEKLTKNETPDVEAMTSELPYLNDMAIKINVVRNSVSDEIKLIEKGIEALGEVDENLPEAKIIAQKRQEFNRELSNEKARLSEIDILSAKIDELNLRIFDIRNQLLWGNLLKAETALINPATFFTANNELFNLALDIIKSPFVWYNDLNAEQQNIVNENIVFVIPRLMCVCV